MSDEAWTFHETYAGSPTLRVRDAAGGEVADITTADGRPAGEREWGHARLIAAAPDLLAACEVMLAKGKGPTDVDAAYAMMRAAVAKATGASE